MYLCVYVCVHACVFQNVNNYLETVGLILVIFIFIICFPIFKNFYIEYVHFYYQKKKSYENVYTSKDGKNLKLLSAGST